MLVEEEVPRYRGPIAWTAMGKLSSEVTQGVNGLDLRAFGSCCTFLLIPQPFLPYKVKSSLRIKLGLPKIVLQNVNCKYRCEVL